MKTHHTCPCCSESMLRHLDRDLSYWFCRHCWLKMPDAEANKVSQNLNSINSTLTTKQSSPKAASVQLY